MKRLRRMLAYAITRAYFGKERAHRAVYAFPAGTVAVAVPCGSHDIDFKGADCTEVAHHDAADGDLLCWLAEGHEGPHFDCVDGHWQVSGDGTVELSRCQKVVTAQ